MHGVVLAEDNIGGRYADNDLQRGTRGTRIEAREQNAVYFEIANAIAEAAIPFNGQEETQLAQAIITIAKREGAMNALELSIQQSPQTYNLKELGIATGHYAASLTVIGSNDADISLSYQINGDNLTIYSWYTNAEGKRSRGVPISSSDGWFGKSFGSSFGGNASSASVKIALLLTAL